MREYDDERYLAESGDGPGRPTNYLGGRMVKLVYFNTGDWVGVYRDGRLLDQGHSFGEGDLLRLLGVEYESVRDVDAEANGWQLPDVFDDLK